MRSSLICPFFDTSKEWCEAGTDYVSVYDAREIVTNCICSYRNCARYIELVNEHYYVKTSVKILNTAKA